MKGGNSPRAKSHPVRHGARTSPPHVSGKRVMIKIIHTVTSDSPDGQPWPPPDSGALCVIVRRAHGRTLWRAVHLVISRCPVIAAATEKTKVPRSLIGYADALFEQPGHSAHRQRIHRDLGACPNATGRLAGHDMHRRSSS